MKKSDKFLQESLEYMSNLPKIYVEELGLSGDIFFGIMGHLCDIAQDEGEDSGALKYMPLQYDVVQKYCSQGFSAKYVCSHYSQYCRTINAAILVYYKILRSDEHKFDHEEYETLFGNFFLNDEDLNELSEEDIFDCFEPDEQSYILKEQRSGNLQKKFEENWRKKRGILLENQIERSQIIRDNFFLEEEFNELADKGATLKRVINFLDKLEDESHERCADNVLIPYNEYHALHDMLSEHPGTKAILHKGHDRIIRKLERVFGFQEKKKL